MIRDAFSWKVARVFQGSADVVISCVIHTFCTRVCVCVKLSVVVCYENLSELDENSADSSPTGLVEIGK